MIFISTHSGQEYILRHTRREVLETADMGKITQVKEGIRVKFKALTTPFETTLLPTRNGSNAARGILDSKVAAYQTGLTEQEIIDYLLNHRMYGVQHVAVEDDAGEVDIDEAKFFVSQEDGTIFCKLCQKIIKTPQGVNGLLRS